MASSVHPRISVSQICSWNWTLEQDLAHYAGRGWRTIGLHHRKLEAHGVAAAVERVRQAGIEVTSLIASTPFRVADEASWDGQRARLRELAEDARQLGSPMLCTTTGPADGMPWDEACDALEQLLAPVLADGLAVPLVLEHTNPFRVDLSFLLCLRDAIDLAERIGVGVCVETNACWSERGLDRLAREGAGVIRLVQVSDFALGTMCSADRRVPGDGDIPWARVIGCFEDAGYEGYYDLELIGPHIEQEGYAGALDRSVARLDELLRASER